MYPPKYSTFLHIDLQNFKDLQSFYLNCCGDMTII